MTTRSKFPYEAKGVRGHSRNIKITALGRRILKALEAGTYRTAPSRGPEPRRAKR